MPTTFTLRRFNPIRASRGAPAAEVEVTHDDGETELLWMSQRDIANNIEEFVEHADLSGLLLARKHYRTRKEYP